MSEGMPSTMLELQQERAIVLKSSTLSNPHNRLRLLAEIGHVTQSAASTEQPVLRYDQRQLEGHTDRHICKSAHWQKRCVWLNVAAWTKGQVVEESKQMGEWAK